MKGVTHDDIIKKIAYYLKIIKKVVSPEKYISILPHEMSTFFSKEHFHESSIKICLNQQQLGGMLSQAEGNFIDKADASNFDTASLLKKQFPIASFHMVCLDPQKSFEKLINEYKESKNSFFGTLRPRPLTDTYTRHKNFWTKKFFL